MTPTKQAIFMAVLALVDRGSEVIMPVMAKCRIGHAAEALVLQSLGVDMIDESEVLTPAVSKVF